MKFKYAQFNPTPYESHALVYSKIKEGSKVLDAGCATGYFAKELKKKKCQVWGIEQNKEAAKLAEKYCEKVVIGDLEQMDNLPFPKGSFDYILFLDVLEHLREPLSILNLVEPYLKAHVGKIIISVPNVAHISIRLRLILGKFDYEEKGIMDHTHLRFFTKKTLVDMIRQAGWQLSELDCSADFGQLPVIAKIARKIPKQIQYFLTGLSPTLLSAQFIAICQKKI